MVHSIKYRRKRSTMQGQIAMGYAPLKWRNLIGQHAWSDWLQEVSINTPRLHISRKIMKLASYRARHVSEPLVQAYGKM